MMCEKWKRKHELATSTFYYCFDVYASMWLIFESDLNQ